MVQVPEQDNSEGTSQLIPEFFTGGKLGSALLIRKIAEIKNLMDKKRQQIQDKKVH